MANLKLQDWTDMFSSLAWNAIGQEALIVPRSKALEVAARTFCANCSRVLFAARFTNSMFGAGRLFQVAESLASNEVKGDPFKYAAQHTNDPPLAVRALRDDYLCGRQKTPFVVAASAKPDDVQAVAERHGLEADITNLMSMQIVAIWAIFETLFSDLWEAAVSSGPSPRLDAKGRPLKISDFYFARFQKKQGIYAAFSAAFHVDGADIERTIRDDSLRCLFAIRNVIAHKAGRCDAKYLDDAKMFPHLPQLNKGDVLTADGAVLREFVPPALDCCLRLVLDVDTWLLTHP